MGSISVVGGGGGGGMNTKIVNISKKVKTNKQPPMVELEHHGPILIKGWGHGG